MINPNLDKEQVTCEDVLDDLRDVFKLFIDRTLFLDCLLIDPEFCYAALRGEDPLCVEDNTQQGSKGKKKDGRRSNNMRKGSKKNVNVVERSSKFGWLYFSLVLSICWRYEA